MRRKKGFGLIEITLLAVILGLASVLLFPRLHLNQEREKASEAFKTLEAVQQAQEKYREATGVYASDLKQLEIQETAAAYFDFGSFEAGQSGSIENSWSMTMTRRPTDRFKGEYTVTFTDQGFDPNESTISDLPGIAPIQA